MKRELWLAFAKLALYRLDADIEVTAAAIEYAVAMERLEIIGSPVAYAKLLDPGRRLFADADVAFPRQTARTLGNTLSSALQPVPERGVHFL